MNKSHCSYTNKQHPSFQMLILLMLCFPVLALTQSPTPSANQNYILQRQAKVPAGTTSDLEALNLDTESTVQIQYMDGLGRAMQSIDVMAAPDQTDVVQPVSYDELGRSPKQYLPFNRIGSPNNRGAWVSNPLAKQLNFYDESHLDLTDQPWAESTFEASPLSRVLEQGAPGADWQPGTGHTIRSTQRSNLASDQVYDFGIAPQSGQNYSSTYPAGELLEQESRDENGNRTWSYTDKLGRTIMSQQELSGADARTYYLYTQKGELKYVLQPQGVAEFESNNYGGSYTLSQALLNDFAFQYDYDARGQMISKQVPGAGRVDMIYDPLGRVVFSQDAVQRGNGQWSFNKYDVHGRPIITGVFSSSKNRETLQTDLTGWWDSGFYQLYEIPKSGSQSLHGYSDREAYPEVWWGSVDVHSVSYYDHYDFNRDGDENDPEETHLPESLYGEGDGSLSISSVIWSRVKGKITGVRTWILNPDSDMPSSLFTRTYYDKYGREIQTIADNHLGGTEQMSYQYNFAGELLYQAHRHTYDGEEVLTQEWFSYDHRSRLLRHEHQIGDQPRIILADYTYNELGQVSQEQLHSQDQGGMYLQSIDQQYNVRGWLTEINSLDPMCGANSAADFATQISLSSIGLTVIPPSKIGKQQALSTADFQIQLTDDKQVTFFDVSAGSSYTQDADLSTHVNIYLPGTVSGAGIPRFSLSFSPEVILLGDGQYTAVYSQLQTAIQTNFSSFSQADQDSIIAQVFRKIKMGFDNLFEGGQDLDLFRMKLRYNEGFTDLHSIATPQYNGNISGIEWQSPLDCAIKGYGFRYDEMNRLLQAKYGEQSSTGGNWSQNQNAYNSFYSYDLNGNFLSLNRNKPNGSGGVEQMDLLQFQSYQGNRLLKVKDNASLSQIPGLDHFVDGNTSGNDYAYDLAGNRTQDLNKGINMSYNHLNKLTEVDAAIGKIVYIYSADGTKLRQKVLNTSGTSTKITDYAGAFQYEDPDGSGTADNSLSFVLHPKGRLLPDQGEMRYQYFLKDHLGSTRILFGDLDGDGRINPDPVAGNDVDQLADYYPFGLRHGASSVIATPAQNYTYTGKEVQDELGIGLIDYGARMYDPTIGSWGGVDALAEKYLAWSPYNYALNNPIRFIDPDGNSPLPTEPEREAAIAKAQEYANESSGNEFGYSPNGDKNPGAKGSPGEPVDCSGLVSGCIMAAGLPDPILTGEGPGTTRIKNNTTPIENVDDIEPGNGVFISFNANGGTGHTGLITDVTRNNNGDVTKYNVIHSGSSTGPIEITIVIGGAGYYDTNHANGNKVSGFYKWDTPDISDNNLSLNQVTPLAPSSPSTISSSPRDNRQITYNRSNFEKWVNNGVKNMKNGIKQLWSIYNSN